MQPVGDELTPAVAATDPSLPPGGDPAAGPRADSCDDSYDDSCDDARPSRPAFHARRAVTLHPAARRWLLDADDPTQATPLTPGRISLRQSFIWLAPGFYRIWLLLATAVLTAALLYVQSLVGAVPPHPTLLQRGVQWAELIWLAPVPLAIALWLGWFLFADAARPDPEPVAVPWHARAGLAPRPVRLVFRFVTRGENQEVLRDAVAAVHAAVSSYPGGGPYRIEVISEHPVDLGDAADSAGPASGELAVFVVPRTYATANHSRFKARALTYLQGAVQPQPGDWFVYLDEESAVDTPMIAGLYRFIWKAYADAAREHAATPRLIGQGSILYQGGTWFFRGADALRTADDIGRFRLQYALGMPLFGVHGSFIVVSGEDDHDLSFDVGARNSLTEDAAWALRAWSQGYRFGWVEGYLREQPPQRTADFVRQRARWLSGIRQVLRDELVPLRYRACLGAFTVLWQLSFLPFLVTLAAVAVHIAPPVWMRLPADFAWATFVLAYLQGADMQAKRVASATESSRLAGLAAVRTDAPRPELMARARAHALRLAGRVASWVLALCYIWYALLEAAGVVYSLRPKKDFFVIYKPSLKPGLTRGTSPQPVADQPTDLPASHASLARRPQ